MPQCVLSAAVARARRVVRLPVTDGALVARFAATRDPEAFAELVRRHGPMVFAVCRRVTRHRQDAEDAFQAAFLVLAKKAGTVSPPGAVANFLFGVAVNAAREARKRAARRCARESLVATLPETGRLDPEPDFDARIAVVEELAKLPERYRSLVVCCDLEGEPQTAVARRLGVPVGTMYSRLSTARRLLADRLRRRGVAAGVGAALAVSAPDAAALPSVSDCPSPRVTELTEAVMRSGFALWSKLAEGVLVLGVALGFAREAPRPAPTPAPQPREADESRIVLGFTGHVRFLKPDGTEVSRLTGADAVKAGADMPTRVATVGLSSNEGLVGSIREAFVSCGRAAPDGRLPLDTRKGLYLLTPGEKPTVAPAKAAKGDAALFASGNVPYIVAWSPDGTKAIGRRQKHGLFGTRYEHVRIDLTAGTAEDLKLPRNHEVVDWSPDGTWFLTIRDDQEWSLLGGSNSVASVLCKVSADGKTSEELSKPGEGVRGAALSPDGERVAYQVFTTTGVKEDKHTVLHPGIEVVVLDLATGARKVVASEPGGKGADGSSQINIAYGVRWSPDGKRVGFAYEHRKLGTPFVVGWRVGVTGTDGTGTKTVFAEDVTDPKAGPLALSLFDWR